jgi:hypothetical protein
MKRAELLRYAEAGASGEAMRHVLALGTIFTTFPGIRDTTLKALNNGHLPPSTNGAANGEADRATTPIVKRKRRKMSAEARKRISEAQKARWAKQNKGRGRKKSQEAPANA